MWPSWDTPAEFTSSGNIISSTVSVCSPFPEAREGWEVSRGSAPDVVLLSGFPQWLHLGLGLHSIFRLKGSRCFSGLTTCHPSVLPAERYGSISVHARVGRGRFAYCLSCPQLPLSTHSALSCAI